jgi:chromate transport protein ChrA
LEYSAQNKSATGEEIKAKTETRQPKTAPENPRRFRRFVARTVSVDRRGFGFADVASQTYLFFTQAAFVTFGGAYAVLAYVNQAVVAAGWITAAQSVDGLALAETTPGPLIMVLQFIGFMTGWNNAGPFDRTSFAVLCGLLTTYVTFLPSFLFIFVGAPYIERLRHNRNLTSALSGVTAAVVGVILNLALTFGATVVFPNFQIDFFAFALAALAFLALYFSRRTFCSSSWRAACADWLNTFSSVKFYSLWKSIRQQKGARRVRGGHLWITKRCAEG